MIPDDHDPGPDVDIARYNALVDRLKDAQIHAARLDVENKRLHDENMFLRTDINDLMYRNRELVNGRVKMTWSPDPRNDAIYVKLAINNLALVMARDPRAIVEHAFHSMSAQVFDFIRNKDREVGIGET